MSNQLIKTTELGKENVFPITRILDLFDDASGLKLIDILNSFNMLFVPYLGNKPYTRNQISPELRRQGLWLTYVIDNTVYTEWYDKVAIDDTNWGSDANWRQGSNALVGDLSVSPNGTWVINGEDSGITIKGDKGDSPVIRIYNNKILVSYDKGVTYEDLNNTPVYTMFRTNDNRLLVSTDLGNTWENCSEPIAAWFRWADTSGTGNIGKVLISRDNNTWEDLSPNITNNLYIKGYVSTIGNLPSSAAMGDIYMVGPTYDESDTTLNYPHYRMWVKLSSGWVDNGEYLSNVLISQTTGLETGITMSLKVITDKIHLNNNFFPSDVITTINNGPGFCIADSKEKIMMCINRLGELWAHTMSTNTLKLEDLKLTVSMILSLIDTESFVKNNLQVISDNKWLIAFIDSNNVIYFGIDLLGNIYNAKLQKKFDNVIEKINESKIINPYQVRALFTKPFHRLEEYDYDYEIITELPLLGVHHLIIDLNNNLILLI